jgi:putative transposase
MTRIYHGRNLRKGRVSQSNQIYLITVVTFNSNNLFHDYSTGRFVVRELVESERRERAHTLAFVVMPDHLHWLFSLSGENKLSAVIGPMKRHSAKNINRVLNSTG